MSKIKLAIVSRDYKEYLSLFKGNKAVQEQFDVIYAGLNKASSKFVYAQKVTEVLISEPDLAATFVHNCQSLLWLQSTWAGNNRLQNCELAHVKVTGVKGIFAQRMSEYVLSYILYFHRKIEQYQKIKALKKWQQLQFDTLNNKTLGIMGFGSIGQDLAKTAGHLGMNVLGYSTRIKNIPNVTEYTCNDMHTFISQCDYVVNLLPETQATIAMCNGQFFSQMKKGAVFINAGRGSIIDKPQSLIKALNSGHLKAAVLDVFEKEPLPKVHPYYTTDNIFISCHTAAVSETSLVFEVFCKNAQRYVEKNELLYLHDFNKGY